MSRFRQKSPSSSRSKSRSRDRTEKPKQEHQRIQYQPTKSLSINKTIQTSLVQQTFDFISIQVGTSLPDQVQHLQNKTVIRYPSIDVASKIINQIKSKVTIDNTPYTVQYFPKKEAALIQDWYCEKCGYGNFARRNKCNKCQSFRTPSCRTILNSNSIVRSEAIKNRNQINPYSLMLRGAVISEIDEGVLIDIFEHYGSLKDVRLIRNKMTGGNRQFCFLEFHTVEEAAEAYKQATNPYFTIQGKSISCLYSKNRKDQVAEFDEYYEGKPRSHVPKQSSQQEYKPLPPKQPQLITMQKLKQKKALQLKQRLLQNVPKQLSKQKTSRKQAQLEMQKWEQSIKTQVATETEIMYICPICVRKFKGSVELKNHQEKSAMHQKLFAMI